MKLLLLSITCLVLTASSGQKIPAFYDYKWTPCPLENARYFSEVIKTDSGWLRNDYFLGNHTLQMKGLYEDSATKIANGFFYYYYANGVPERFGKNVHNKKEGVWMRYHHNGFIEDSTVYLDGQPSGISMGWHTNGFTADSVTYDGDDSAVEVDWSSNGSPSGAGRMKNGKTIGTWQYFHDNGKIAAQESYDVGRLVNKSYYNLTGEPEDTASKDRTASFPGGQRAWEKFIVKEIYFPPEYKLTNTDHVTVVITAIIDEEGNIVDPFVEVPFDKRFDDIAVNIFKKSPKWLPAISHNRAVLQIVRQPITFLQSE